MKNYLNHLNYSLTDTQEMVNMYRAANHRRAELVSGGKLFDVARFLNPFGDSCSKAVILHASCLYFPA